MNERGDLIIRASRVITGGAETACSIVITGGCIAAVMPLPGHWLDDLREEPGSLRPGGMPDGAIRILTAMLAGPPADSPG